MSRRRSDVPRYLEEIQLSPKLSASPPSPEPDLSRHPAWLALRICAKLKPNLKHWPDIDPGKWNDLGITCHPEPLDLNWESNNKAGFGFSRLMTLEKMRTIADQYEFDGIEELCPDPRHPFANSESTQSRLHSYLKAIYGDKYLIEETEWNIKTPNDWQKKYFWYISNDIKWGVQWYLRIEDGRLPHTNCVLLEGEELQEHSLKFSEVWLMLIFTVFFYCKFRDSEHKFVPVTVLTISGTTFRIVQGFVDGESGILKVRKSRIVSLIPGREKEQDGMKLMVRWLLAEPVQLHNQ